MLTRYRRMVVSQLDRCRHHEHMKNGQPLQSPLYRTERLIETYPHWRYCRLQQSAWLTYSVRSSVFLMKFSSLLSGMIKPRTNTCRTLFSRLKVLVVRFVRLDTLADCTSKLPESLNSVKSYHNDPHNGSYSSCQRMLVSFSYYCLD